MKMNIQKRLNELIGILLLLIIFLIVPVVGRYLTPSMTIHTPESFKASRFRIGEGISIVYANPLYGRCLQCQQGSNKAWFSAYDSCRAADPNGDPQICTAAGDRASACYIIHNWSASCETCGGVIPDQSECGE